MFTNNGISGVSGLPWARVTFCTADLNRFWPLFTWTFLTPNEVPTMAAYHRSSSLKLLGAYLLCPLFTKNTGSLILPILNTKSKPSVCFSVVEAEHQLGPPSLFEAAPVEQIASQCQKWDRSAQSMLRTTPIWTSGPAIQMNSECDIYCIAKLSCPVWGHWETSSGGSSLNFRSKHVMSSVLQPCPIWVRLAL